MGVIDPSTREGLFKAVPKDENQAKLLMMMLFKQQYQNQAIILPNLLLKHNAM